MFKKGLLAVGALWLAFSIALPVFATDDAEIPMVSNDYPDMTRFAVLSEIALDIGINIVGIEDIEGYVSLYYTEKPVPYTIALDEVCGSEYVWRKIVENGYKRIVVAPKDPENPNFQSLSETLIVEPRFTSANEIKESLPDFFQQFVKVGGEKLAIRATPEMIKDMEEDIAKFDQPRKQVEVQLWASEVSQRALKEIGVSDLDIEWGRGLEKVGEIYSIAVGLFSFGATGVDSVRTAVLLRMLFEEGKATLMGSPKIRVLEGREALIEFTEERHILILAEGVEIPEYIGKETVEAKTGLKVKVKRITDKNEIVFDSVKMDLGEILGTQQATRGEVIRVNKRNMETSLVLNNYETLPIGSLTIERDKAVKRVYPPYKGSDKETVILQVYMTANVAGTPKPESHEEEIARMLKKIGKKSEEHEPTEKFKRFTFSVGRWNSESLAELIVDLRIRMTENIALFGGFGGEAGSEEVNYYGLEWVADPISFGVAGVNNSFLDRTLMAICGGLRWKMGRVELGGKYFFALEEEDRKEANGYILTIGISF